MGNDKPLIKSKTVSGSVLAVLPVLLQAMGVGAGDTVLIHEAIDALITFGGAVLAIYGRYVADKKITKIF